MQAFPPYFPHQLFLPGKIDRRLHHIIAAPSVLARFPLEKQRFQKLARPLLMKNRIIPSCGRSGSQGTGNTVLEHERD